MLKKIGWGLIFCLAVGWYLYMQFRSYEMDIDHQEKVQNFKNLSETEILQAVICLDKAPTESTAPFVRLTNCAQKITINQRDDLVNLLNNTKKWRLFEPSHPVPENLYNLYIILNGDKRFYYFDIYKDPGDKRIGISGAFGTLQHPSSDGNLGYYRSDEIVNWIENQIETHPIDKRELIP